MNLSELKPGADGSKKSETSEEAVDTVQEMVKPQGANSKDRKPAPSTQTGL